ncbi:MAG: hypothetical protein LBJ70_01510 [Holosporales bacterium]|nr:hypothetical protein [Holosporales bacterium]
MPNFSRLLLLTATFVTFSVGGMDRDTEEIPGPMFHGERDVAEQHFEHLLMHPDPETQLMNAQKLVLHPEGVPEHILQRAQDVRERHFLLLDDADPNVRLEAAQTIVRSDRDPGNWPAHVREKVQEIMVGHP